MIEKEKFKEILKKSFSNSPKAKIIVAFLVMVMVLTLTIVSMRRTVDINIDGKVQTVVTYKRTVEDVLASEGIKLKAHDKVQPSLQAQISENEKINVKIAVPIKVVVAGQEHELYTTEKTVEDALVNEKEQLKKAGIEYNQKLDEVTPSEETQIKDGLEINLVKVDINYVTEQQDIQYQSSTDIDYDKDVAYSEVVQQGVNGKKEVVYKVKKCDGKEVAKEVSSEKIISQPQDEKIVKGGSHFMVSRSGEGIKVQKTYTVRATAYTGGTKTATGRTPVRDENGISTIAVDPRVIPLGSLVYVEGYGKAIAADTGSAIKGNIIDLYYNTASECKNWGRRSGIEVGIIAYPGEW